MPLAEPEFTERPLHRESVLCQRGLVATSEYNYPEVIGRLELPKHKTTLVSRKARIGGVNGSRVREKLGP